MERHKLQPLNDHEKKFAEENHGLVYSYLRRNGYSIEEYYDIVVFGYLKAVQLYHRKEDLKKYSFAQVSWLSMKSEISNHFTIEKALKRKPAEAIVSLDAEYADGENLYNTVGGKSFVINILDDDFVERALNHLSDSQRKMTRLKMDGYNNKEVCVLMDITQTVYYSEMRRIKAIVRELMADQGKSPSQSGKEVRENMAVVLTNGVYFITTNKRGGITKTPYIEQAQQFYDSSTANRKLQRAPGKCKGYYILEIGKKKKKKRRKHYSADARKMIYNKADGRCALCGRKILFEEMTLDHIIPLAMNGSDEVENLQCACELCNKAKASALPEEFIDRISSIFLYQMEKKYADRIKWKIVHKLLKKMV